MSRHNVIFIPLLVALFFLYAFELAHVRTELHQESARIAKALANIEQQNAAFSRTFFSLAKTRDFAESGGARGIFVRTLYSKLGLSPRSHFPPVPPGILPEKTSAGG